MSDFDTQFGKRIARLREELGLTQTDVAKHMSRVGHSWHQPTVARVEAGARPVRASELTALADAFGVTAEALLSGETPVRAWPRWSRVSPDVPEVTDYLGHTWTQIHAGRWESADGEFEVPFAFLAEHYGPLREVAS